MLAPEPRRRSAIPTLTHAPKGSWHERSSPGGLEVCAEVAVKQVVYRSCDRCGRPTRCPSCGNWRHGENSTHGRDSTPPDTRDYAHFRRTLWSTACRRNFTSSILDHAPHVHFRVSDRCHSAFTSAHICRPSALPRRKSRWLAVRSGGCRYRLRFPGAVS